MGLQEPSLTASLSAVETLYTLALFNAHEPEFSNLFRTLSSIRSHLKVKQRNALNDSKITTYFQNVVTEEKEIPDSGTDSGEIIVVD